MGKQLDRLTGQLYHLPAIVGRFGISIAEAQKELNADYLKNISELMRLIKETMGSSDSEPNETQAAAFATLLESLAPSRYQFTETTLDFSADLAEHLSVGVDAGASAGLGAVAVNAAVSVGYGRDYRAAARVTTKLHAFQNADLAKSLLARAKEIDVDKLPLPERAKVDDDILESTTKVFSALTGADAEPSDGT